MKTLTEDFNDFVDKISLEQSIVDDIISKHNSLTDMIKKNPPDGYKIVKTRLSGSYAKYVVLNEYNPQKRPDVDVIIIVETDETNVDKINADFLSYFKCKKENCVSEIRQQSNSIGLIYANISVDIVIAVETSSPDVLKITSHKNHDWIITNSLKHITYIKEQNARYEGFSYYSLMKLFKFLNKEILKTNIKSYTLEQLVHKCVPKPRIGLRLYQAFVETLENISNLDSIESIKDCCDCTKDGYDEKDKMTFNMFLYEIKDYLFLAKDALNGERKKWESIFGERFPNQPEEKVINEGNYDKSQTPWCL